VYTRHVRDRFVAVTKAGVLQDEDSGLVDLLRSDQLYKSLSLVLACNAGVKVPPSLLLLVVRRNLIAKFANEFGYPLMIRVDYRSRPKAKPFGGVPLYTLDTMQRVSEDLIGQGCLPIFHPHLDRFKDVFSCGVLFTDQDHKADVEIVGTGFDAGDLRLGKAIPHETVQLNLATGSIERRTIIADDVYQRERSARTKAIHRLKAYSDFVNHSAKLLADLGRFDLEFVDTDVSERMIPEHYETMPSPLLKELLGIVRVVKSDVLGSLPHSKVYVASLSYLPIEGWVLWDVYGDWYLR